MNVAAAAVLSRTPQRGLNVEAALRHVFADILGSLGVAVAALVILTTGWMEADPLVSILIGVLVLVSSWTVLRDATSILLEASPKGVDTRRSASVSSVLRASSRCTTSTSGRSRPGFPPCRRTSWLRRERTATAAAVSSSGSCENEFAIEHTTLQVDHANDGGLVEMGRF